MVCADCVFIGEEPAEGVFEVEVPVRSADGERHYLATLRYTVDGVSLGALTTHEGAPVEAGPRLTDGLNRSIEQVTASNLCGNEQVCPREVVERIRHHG